MSRVVFIAALLVATTTGCIIGGTVENYEPAHTASGRVLTLTVGTVTLSGELLAVQDSTVMMVVRWPNPDSSSVPRLARFRIPGSWTPGDRSRYTLEARYPGGVTASLEARLAAAYAVDSVRWLP
jgi:hypothetical protein